MNYFCFDSKKALLGRAFLCIVLLSSSLLLTSCQNFLSSKGVKEEIKEKIEYSNAKTVKVNLSCEKEMGTFYPEGYYTAKLGFSFELQFVPNTENYVIKDYSTMLEAVSRLSEESRADYVEFKLAEQSLEDEKLGLYRINVKILKDADDIMVRPAITPLPKVIDFYPPNNPSGVNQDTTISIAFNKPVNPDSFGDFSCITILDSDDNDITSCYETPFFSNDNTILHLRKTAGNLIIAEASEKNLEDVTLTIDFSNIFDSDGIHFEQTDSYTFRVNKNIDRVKPVLTSVLLSTTSDTSASYYRTLTDESFSDWSSSATSQNPFGAYSQNHVGRTIYLEASGYDKDSGVNGIQIVETYWKTVDGKDTTHPDATGVCGINKFVYTQTDTSNNNIYSLNDSYKLVSMNEGIIKLDISLLDKAGNVSEPITYYVLKDTSIESTSIQFEETQSYNNYYPIRPWLEDDEYIDIFDHVRISQNGNDAVVLTLTDTSIDTFYTDASLGLTCSSQYDIEIYYGDSEDSINTKALKSNNTFTFNKRAGNITLVKLICSDAVGNTMEFLRALPSKPMISKYEYDSYDRSDDSGRRYQFVRITPSNEDLYSAMAKSYGADSSGIFYVIRNNDTENSNFGTSYMSEVSYWGDDVYVNTFYELIDYTGTYDYKSFDIYIVLYFQYGDTFWYSALSDDYVNTFAYGGYDSRIKREMIPNPENPYDPIEGDPIMTLLSSISYNSIVSGDYPPYLKDNITVTATPCVNSGCYKIVLDNYKATGIDTSDIVYTFMCEDYDTGEKLYFDDPVFYLKTMRRYYLYTYATDPNGVFYDPDQYDYVHVNGGPTITLMELKEDLTPPSFDNSFHIFTSDTASCYIETSLPVDGPEDFYTGSMAGMLTDPDNWNYGFIDYYFIPNSNTSARDYSLYTLSDLDAYEKHTLRYKFTDTSLKIPYGGLEEGLYTICLVARDNNGNYTIKCGPAFNKTVGEKLPVTFINTGEQETFIYALVSPQNDFGVDFYDTDTNQWINASPMAISDYASVAIPDKWTFPFGGKEVEDYNGWFKIFSIKYDIDEYFNINYDISQCGFYYVDYLYTPYHKGEVDEYAEKIVCSKKSICSYSGGYKVLCDHSVLAHTLYCSKKLTETTGENDIAIWETKGVETGFVIKDSDFNYTLDNYDEIPNGWYYTTVFRFADGYAQMTEIKQK